MAQEKKFLANIGERDGPKMCGGIDPQHIRAQWPQDRFQSGH